MADEQTQSSDLIDDAIREAEEQLQERLSALRTSTLEEIEQRLDGHEDNEDPAPEDAGVAELRHTGEASGWSQEADSDHDDIPWSPEPGRSAAPEQREAPPANDAILEPTRPVRGRSDESTVLPPTVNPWDPEQDRDEFARTVVDQVARVVSEEIDGPAAAVRQLQEDLPLQVQKIAALNRDMLEYVQHTIPERLAALRDELRETLQRDVPTRVATLTADMQDALQTAISSDIERAESSLRTTLHSDLQQFESTIRDMVQAEVDRVEQSVAGNVVRLSQELVQRLETSENTIVDEMGSVTALARQLHEDSPNQFARIDRKLDKAQLQHAQDVESMIDALTNSLYGMTQAVESMVERVNVMEERMRNVETDYSSMRTLEAKVADHLDAINRQVSDMQPAPVVVTVNHPDAQVDKRSRHDA